MLRIVQEEKIKSWHCSGLQRDFWNMVIGRPKACFDQKAIYYVAQPCITTAYYATVQVEVTTHREMSCLAEVRTRAVINALRCNSYIMLNIFSRLEIK